MDAIKNAIAEVKKQGNTETVNISGSIEDVEAYGESLGYSVDYRDIGDSLYDVWGWTDETPENEEDWRIMVQIGISDKMAVDYMSNTIGDTTPFSDEWWKLFNIATTKLDRDGYDWSNRYPEVDYDGIITGICEGDSDIYRAIGPDGFAMVRHSWADDLEENFGDVWDHSDD